MTDHQQDQQAVMAVLEPYFRAISEIYEAAVRLYNEGTTAQARADHDSRAALSAIYRHAWMGDGLSARTWGSARLSFLEGEGASRP